MMLRRYQRFPVAAKAKSSALVSPGGLEKRGNANAEVAQNGIGGFGFEAGQRGDGRVSGCAFTNSHLGLLLHQNNTNFLQIHLH